MQDISGFGLRIVVRASQTFPQGITLSEFADDGDPYDNPSQQLADKAMGLNGDLIVWTKANATMVTVNLIPDGENDKDMSVLTEANRPSRGKAPAGDVITMTILYPDGRTDTLTNGKLTDASVTTAVGSSGRRKTKAYAFAFEGLSRN